MAATSPLRGSHIVIGGATVLDSPILRRPDLLRSMLAFWQNHPSLSYLFSGMYCGPTSQYPRVDEARQDTLYELEIAFGQLPSSDCAPTLWMGCSATCSPMSPEHASGRVLRRQAFPPPGFGSQFGLLELRAFEMPPHVRMNLCRCYWSAHL